MVGQAFAARLAELGHEVTVGTRDPGRHDGAHRSGRAWATRRSRRGPPQHPRFRLATFADAAAPGELVVNATTGWASIAVLEQAGAEHLAGKMLIDIANPLDFSAGFPPTLFVKDTDSLGEQIQRTFPRPGWSRRSTP